MADVQPEHGVTPIANVILEKLWLINLSSYEVRVLLYLIRKTYGWHKKTDWIALSQFSKDIGIDRRLVHRTLKSLSSRGMIVVIPSDDKRRVCYGFQKDYDKWNLSSIKMTHKKVVIPQDDGVSSPEIPTKETLTKERLNTLMSEHNFVIPRDDKKKRTKTSYGFPEDSDAYRLAALLLQKILERKPNFSKPNLQNWAKYIDKILRIKRRSPKSVENVICWCQKDDFWQNNILSTVKLYEKLDQLELKMEKETGVAPYRKANGPYEPPKNLILDKIRQAQEKAEKEKNGKAEEPEQNHEPPF